MADHNAYHLGQLVTVRRLLGAGMLNLSGSWQSPGIIKQIV